MVQTVKQWLSTYPGWGDTRLWVDSTHYSPNSAGLYPEGLEQVASRQDILGNTTVTNRLRFVLCRVVSAQSDTQENARWLLDLQLWVQQQNAQGLAPVFGQHNRWRAESGKLEKSTNALTRVYKVHLTVEYEM